MPAIPVEIAGVRFAKKGDAMEWCKELLNSKTFGERFDGSVHEKLLGLIELHPEREEKIGCGVDFFFVDKSLGHSTRCFWIKRKDGSGVDFSYKHCIDQKGKSADQDFSAACREAVQKDIEIAKTDLERENNGVFICERTGKKLTRDQIHADHQPPFDQLVKWFKKMEKVDPSDPSLYEPRIPGSFDPTRLSPVWKSKFQEFHREYAEIRMVERVENLRNASKQATKAVKNPLKLRSEPVVCGGSTDQQQLPLAL